MLMVPFKFGFIVTGKCSDTDDCRSTDPCTLFVAAEFFEKRSDYQVQCSINISTIKNPDLERFWHLETIGISDPLDAQSDDEALRGFNENIKFENERYQVTWPWKLGNEDLSHNFSVTVVRLKSLLRRFQVDKKL